jgi:hypothetical protein
MEITIQMFGLEKVHNMLLELPKHTETEIDKAEGEFMAFVQKSAKLRAPRLTGALAQSIEKWQEKKGTWKLIVGSPYGWFQEHGFRAHTIKSWWSTRAGEGGGPFISDIYGEFGEGIAKINTPFITPAFESGLNHLPQILQNAMEKAIKESSK